MSFMAGFGAGFSKSWEQGQQRDNEMERDIFKLTFDQYIKNQDADRSDLAKDKEHARAAAAVAKRLGNVEGNDPKAVMAQAYEFIKSGMTQEQVLEEFRKNGAKITMNRPPAEQPLSDQTEQAQEESHVNQIGVTQTPRDQMNTPKDGQQGQSQAASQGSWKDTFAGGLFNSPYSKRDRMTDKAYQKIADSTGQSVDQVRQTVRGDNKRTPLIDSTGVSFTPGKGKDDLPKTAREAYVAGQEAMRRGDQEEGERLMMIYQDMLSVASAEERAKLEGQTGIQSGTPVKMFIPERGEYEIIHVRAGPPDENGNPTWIDAATNQAPQGEIDRITKEEADAQEDLTRHFKEEVIKQTNAKAALGNVLYSSKEAIAIARENPEALTYVTSTGADFATKLLQEGKNIYSIGQELLSTSTPGNFSPEVLAKARKDSQATINNIDQMVAQKKIEKVAAAAAKIKLHNMLSAYEVGMAYDQAGRSMAEGERKMFTDITSDAVTAQRQLENLATLVAKLESNLDNRSVSMFSKDSPMIEDFYKKYRYNPMESSSRRFADSIRTEETLEAYNLMKSVASGQSGQLTRPLTNTGGQNSGQMPQPQGIRIPRSKAEMLANNPTPENIELFKQAYPQVTDEMIQEILNKTRGE